VEGNVTSDTPLDPLAGMDGRLITVNCTCGTCRSSFSEQETYFLAIRPTTVFSSLSVADIAIVTDSAAEGSTPFELVHRVRRSPSPAGQLGVIRGGLDFQYLISPYLVGDQDTGQVGYMSKLVSWYSPLGFNLSRDASDPIDFLSEPPFALNVTLSLSDKIRDQWTVFPIQDGFTAFVAVVGSMASFLNLSKVVVSFVESFLDRVGQWCTRRRRGVRGDQMGRLALPLLQSQDSVN